MTIFSESDQRIHSLVKRSINLKNKVVSSSIPKEKQKKAIRLWIATLMSLRKAVKRNYKVL